MKIYRKSQFNKSPYPGIKVTRQTIVPIEFQMSVDEFLKIDEYYDTGKYANLAKNIILRIIRTHPNLIRAKTEGLL